MGYHVGGEYDACYGSSDILETSVVVSLQDRDPIMG